MLNRLDFLGIQFSSAMLSILLANFLLNALVIRSALDLAEQAWAYTSTIAAKNST